MSPADSRISCCQNKIYRILFVFLLWFHGDNRIHGITKWLSLEGTSGGRVLQHLSSWGTPGADCPRPHADGFWIPSGMETIISPAKPCPVVSHPHSKRVSWCSEETSRVSVCTSCLWSCQAIVKLQGKNYTTSLLPLRNHIKTLAWDRPELGGKNNKKQQQKTSLPVSLVHFDSVPYLPPR